VERTEGQLRTLLTDGLRRDDANHSATLNQGRRGKFRDDAE